ncbi:MAG: hypothetical protein V1913_14880 [Fibrobacterota bacterium]
MLKRNLMFLCVTVGGTLLLAPAQGPAPAGKGRTIVLEASKIEGKLKRPQAALMAIDKRPVFKPIALTTNNIQKDILKSVDTTVFEYRMYTNAFEVTTK